MMLEIESDVLEEIRRIVALARLYADGSLGRRVCDQEIEAATVALINGDPQAMRVRLSAMATMHLTACPTTRNA